MNSPDPSETIRTTRSGHPTALHRAGNRVGVVSVVLALLAGLCMVLLFRLAAAYPAML